MLKKKLNDKLKEYKDKLNQNNEIKIKEYENKMI